MLVSQSLVFIHLTKCGGTFLRSALLEVDGPQRYGGRYHGPWSELPVQYRAMPVITAVRNPYDWWVSWYHFMKTHNWFNPIARAAVDTGNESFSKMLQFIIAAQDKDSNAAKSIDLAIHNFTKSHNSVANDFNKNMTDHMQQNQCGILSWRYNFQLDGIPYNQLTIMRQESLLDDLQQVFNLAGHHLRNDQVEKLMDLPRANTTKRSADYREYYDESSKLAVESLEKLIFKKFDYKF